MASARSFAGANLLRYYKQIYILAGGTGSKAVPDITWIVEAACKRTRATLQGSFTSILAPCFHGACCVVPAVSP